MDTLMLFLRCLWLLTGLTVAKGANVVAGEDRITTFGYNPFTLTCRYTTEVNERPDSISIQQKRYQSSQFIEHFKFNILANSSSYKDADMIRKAQLYMNGNSSVSVTYSSADCNDNGTYKCVFSFSRDQLIYTTSDEMQLAIESEPDVPTMTQSSMDIFTESDEIEFNCSSYVGPSDRTLAWFGVSEGNNHTDFTRFANQSDPVQDQTGPRFCIFKRTSRLKVTLTREHNGMNFRCVVVAPEQQGQGRSCDQSVCTSSPGINVQYGIRQEDLAIQSDPVRPANTFEAGSSVTFTCDVDGNPDPYFKWVKGQDKVIGEGSNKLILDNLSINDSGIYRCQGNNTVGETTYEVERSIGITVVLITTTTPMTYTHNIGEVKTTESPQGLAMVTIIVVICAAVFMVIIIIIIIICCCCRKRKSDKNRREIRMNNSPTGKPNPAFQKSVDRANENTFTLTRASSRISKGPDVLEQTDVPDARNMSRMMIHTPEAGIEQYEPPPVDLSRNDIQFVAGPGALSRPRSRFPVVLDDYDELYPPESLRHSPDYSSLSLGRQSGYRDVNMYPPRFQDMGGDMRRNSDDSGVNLYVGHARPDMMFV